MSPSMYVPRHIYMWYQITIYIGYKNPFTIHYEYKIHSPSIRHNLCMNDVSRHFININSFIYSPTFHVLTHDITNSPSIISYTYKHIYTYTYLQSIHSSSSINKEIEILTL